ncbi:MAG: hypothetical protein R3E56_03415 [Burkholderiaceae bacterium]
MLVNKLARICYATIRDKTPFSESERLKKDQPRKLCDARLNGKPKRTKLSPEKSLPLHRHAACDKLMDPPMAD